jgi:hypothetical protein
MENSLAPHYGKVEIRSVCPRFLNEFTFGITLSSDPFITYTGADLDQSSMQQNQIWELGNALGMITGKMPSPQDLNYTPGSSNEPGAALINCISSQ